MAVKEYPKNGAFNGRIGRTVDDSTEAYPVPPRPPEGAPNVVFVLLDDVGYAHLGCFGSDVDTPNMDRIAAGGLRYSNFHTTAMCSPTRASLLTGCNSHTTGMGGIADQGTGFPGYNALITKRTGYLSEILLEHGYATLAVGKWHLTPREECGLGSSRARWPLGRGFERFYGFMGAETNQWDPDLIHDNHAVHPPATAEEGYHFTEDMADRAIEYVNDLRNCEPDRPFFLYFATGACHAPHQAPREWIDKYAGRFDDGWDAWRERTHARQIEMGLYPEGTQLTARPPWIEAWDGLPADHQALYSRMMEVFAGFLSHTDHQIGRLVEHLEQIGELEDTIIVVLSDNGASAEGGAHGSWNTNLFYNGEPETFELAAPYRDRLGDPSTYPHYPQGWAHAGNTPFQRWKRETHEGGTADPLIVRYPRRIADVGSVRRHYAHVVDVVPTVLDLIGVKAPAEIDGMPQTPMAGASLASTFEDPAAEQVRAQQYYELLGCRAIYQDGWKAVAYHPFIGQSYDPTADPFQPFSADKWELYHVAEDFSEAHDLAEQEPERLRGLVDLWWAEAGRYGALPLHSMRSVYANRPRLSAPRDVHVYRPGGPVASALVVDVRHRAHTLTAEVTVPASGAEGVLVAHGGRFGGYALFVQDGKLRYEYNLCGIERTSIVSEQDVPSGDVVLGARFETAGGPSARAEVTLLIDGVAVGSGVIDRITFHTYTLMGDSFCVGYDDSTPVSESYASPYPFTGDLHRLTVAAEGEAHDVSEHDWAASNRSE